MRHKKREAENHSGNGSSASTGHGRGGKHGRGRGRGNRKGSSSSGPSNSSKPTDNEFRRCGKMGHWARECHSKPKKEQAHIVQEEEEASLLLVKMSPTLSPPAPPLATNVSPLQPSPQISPVIPLPQAEPAPWRAEQEHGGGRPEAGTAGGSTLEVVTATAGAGAAGAATAGSGAPVLLREEKVLAHLDKEQERDAETWVLDTGATNHMSGSRAVFVKLDTAVLGTVRFGDDSVARIEGRGTVVFVCKNGELRSFSDVYYIPQLTTNIVSLGQLDEARYKVSIDDDVMRIREPDRRLLVKVKRTPNWLYMLHIKLAQPSCLAVRGRGDEVAWRWHQRFGHVNMAALWKLAREELVRGLPKVGQLKQLCEACQAGKQRRTSFPMQAEYHARQLLELVHGDLCGPITPATPRGNKYFMLLVDDLSRYMWVAAIP